jgi:hypothetical protein
VSLIKARRAAFGLGPMSEVGQNAKYSPSRCFLLCLQTRTLLGAIGTSHLCQLRIMPRSHSALFDHLVGADKQRGRHSEAKRFGSLQVDHQIEFGRLLYRQIGGLGAFENPVNVVARAMEQID